MRLRGQLGPFLKDIQVTVSFICVKVYDMETQKSIKWNQINILCHYNVVQKKETIAEELLHHLMYSRLIKSVQTFNHIFFRSVEPFPKTHID